MKRDLMIQKRKKARELKGKGWGVGRIARYLMAGKENVRRWLELEDRELDQDNRGWKKGQSRKHQADVKDMICAVRKELEQTAGARIGADAVREVMRERYGRDVSRWLVNITLKESNMLKGHMAESQPVRLFKQLFSLKSLNAFGDLILVVNFIRLKAKQESVSDTYFLSCRYVRPQKTGVVKMIPQQTTASVLDALKELWKVHPIPDILMMSGTDWSMGGVLPHRKSLGRIAFFLLNLGIKPLYLGSEILSRYHTLDGLPDLFSGDFIQMVTDDDGDMRQWHVDDFVLQFRKGAGFSSRRIEMKNRVFKTALKYLDLDNRKIGLFLAFEIFFLQVAKSGGGVSILGIDMYAGDKYIGKMLLCRLDLRFQKLYIYAEGPDDNWILTYSTEFMVQNVKYE